MLSIKDALIAQQQTLEGQIQYYQQYRKVGGLQSAVEAELTLGKVERALQKLSNLNYGKCDSCYEPIASTLLALKPYACECESCASLN